jgi:hypothetical protein
MEDSLRQLAAVIEAEIDLGKELLGNQEAQRAAILGWNAAELIEKLAEKEALLGRLEALEKSRRELVGSLAESDRLPLGALLGRARSSPRASELKALGEEARSLYLRFCEQERAMQQLLGILLAHIREALKPLMETPAPRYEERGRLAAGAPEPRLLGTKA